MKNIRSKTLHLLVSLSLVLSSATFSQQALASENKDSAMVGDLLLARPLGFVGLMLGTGTFVLSLPFTLLGGNVGEAAQALVIAPAKFTFVRPLGSSTSRQQE